MEKASLKVGMLILMQSDIEKSIDFYNRLGLPLKFHIKEKWAEFLIGPVKVGLCPTSNEPYDRHTGIVLETDNIVKLQEQLKEHAIEFLAEPLVSVHGIMASIKDPSGNVIDIYQPTPEKVKEFAEKVAGSN